MLDELRPSSKVSTLTRNGQLYSLAVVLAEIRMGGVLKDIDEGRGIPKTDDPIVEYLKLQELLRSKRIASEVGLKYAKVVEQCFYCDFGLGDADFTKRVLQLGFYDDVVVKLSDCLRDMEEDD